MTKTDSENTPSDGLTAWRKALELGKRMSGVENLFLEDLARDQVYEFLFVCLPLKIQGATGSPIRPVAVVPQRERKDG